jgi:hypothetical protein
VSARFFVAVALLLLIVNIACGGEYHRAIDGKSLVWNNDPKPEDAVSWSGKQDNEGYATGQGTLVWYRVERARVTGSNLPAEKRVPISSYSGKMVRGKLNGPVVAADPNGKFYHGTFANGRRTGDWTAGAPRVRRGELVEAASPAEGPSRKKAEKAEPPPAATVEQARQPLVETIPPKASPTPGGATHVNDSLQSLIAPPSSLRTEVAAESSPAPPAASSPEASSATGAGLNAAEVIELTDAEARARGINLDDYRRPQVQYSSDADTWSVSYAPKAGAAKAFSVAVDGKIKKAELKK